MRHYQKRQPIPAATRAGRIAQNNRRQDRPAASLSDTSDWRALGAETGKRFSAPDNSPLVDVDYSSLEVRVLAQMDAHHRDDKRHILKALYSGGEGRATGRKLSKPEPQDLP